MAKKNDDQSPSDKNGDPKDKKKTDGKLDKRAEALRQNLKRRKAHKNKS